METQTVVKKKTIGRRVAAEVKKERDKIDAIRAEEREKKMDEWIKQQKAEARMSIRAEKMLTKKIPKSLKEITKTSAQQRTDNFLEEFLRNGGNATAAAMVAYRPSSREAAAVIGSRKLKEVRELAQVYMENKGASYGALLEVAIEKMKDSKTPEWWDRVMKIAGYEDFISKSQQAPAGVVNVINTQNDFLKDYIAEGEVIEVEKTDES